MEETTTVASTEPTVEATTTNETTGETTETTYAGGKFKSASALEQGYTELQKSYSQKLGAFDGSPEAYTLAEGKEANDFTSFVETWGKDNQLSNDGFNSMSDAYNKFQEEQAKANDLAQQNYLKAEREKLGEHADTRLKNATDWLKANLGEESINVVDKMMGGAEGIEVIEKIMKLTNGTSPTSIPATIKPDADKVKAMRYAKTENGERRMSVDPAYRAKVMEAEALLRG